MTVNARLSRYLRSLYDMDMEKSGHTAWPTPVIIPLFSWLENLWAENWPDRPVLSAIRAQTLWEKVVSEDRLLSKEIMSSRGIAKTAYDAYSLIREYCITLPEDIYLTEEAKGLKRWAEMYDGEVGRLGFIEPASLPDRVIRLVREGRIDILERVVFAGFDELTPRMASLITAIEGKRGKVEFWPFHPETLNSQPPTPNPISIRSYADEVEEVIQAARWARRSLRPDMRIGFIVPDIERYKGIIRREFTAELNPEAVFPWKDTKEVFNISLGGPLSDEPIVKAALDILSIGADAEDINKISAILLSPYFAATDEEYFSLAGLDARLRRENRFKVSISEIIRIIERPPSPQPSTHPGINPSRGEGVFGYDMTMLRKRLGSWTSSLKEGRGNILPSSWADNLSKLLKDTGWPSRRYAAGSAEYQALNAWNKLMEGFASLDDVLGRISRTEAVSCLSKIANDTIHQPESEECPIQVMGLLESSGIYFDHLWILGAHTDSLPALPSPNPFIPLFIQKRLDLPHSTPERELSFSKRLVNRVLSSAHSIDVSYPKVVDKKEVFVSPLFDHTENPPLEKRDAGRFITESSRLKDAVHSMSLIGDMPPDIDIPPSEEELGMTSGGTSIIKDQSWCPFRAFAIHRLRACGIETPGLGLSAQNRGTIIHSALKAFWDSVRDSVRLREIIGRNDLERIIRDSVIVAFRRSYPIEPLSERYLELEKERVADILREWIKVAESERGDFTVDKTEYTTEMTIEGLKITARLDRIDMVDDGKKIIIDYKTGECNKNDWLTERPRDPQLLVYNLVDTFDAISFAKVKPGECGFIGISKEDDILPGVVSFEKDAKLREKLQGINTWDELTVSWKGVVNGLARQFMEGKNEVDPIEKACDYCDLKGLCRVFEEDVGMEGNE